MKRVINIWSSINGREMKKEYANAWYTCGLTSTMLCPLVTIAGSFASTFSRWSTNSIACQDPKSGSASWWCQTKALSLFSMLEPSVASVYDLITGSTISFQSSSATFDSQSAALFILQKERETQLQAKQETSLPMELLCECVLQLCWYFGMFVEIKQNQMFNQYKSTKSYRKHNYTNQWSYIKISLQWTILFTISYYMYLQGNW